MRSIGDEVTEAMAGVERLYPGLVERPGPQPLSIGWKDAPSQRLRFVKLAQLLIPRPVGPIAVNDLGCLYTSLPSFLDELDSVELSAYDGYDISDAVLEAARSAIDARAELILSGKATRMADYSFASGPFHVKGDCTGAALHTHVREAVVCLTEKSRVGFASAPTRAAVLRSRRWRLQPPDHFCRLPAERALPRRSVRVCSLQTGDLGRLPRNTNLGPRRGS